MRIRDPYKLLRVGYDVDEQTLKRKFRQYAMRYHPDRGGDPQKFLFVKEAYEQILRNLRAGVKYEPPSSPSDDTGPEKAKAKQKNSEPPKDRNGGKRRPNDEWSYGGKGSASYGPTGDSDFHYTSGQTEEKANTQPPPPPPPQDLAESGNDAVIKPTTRRWKILLVVALVAACGFVWLGRRSDNDVVKAPGTKTFRPPRPVEPPPPAPSPSPSPSPLQQMEARYGLHFRQVAYRFEPSSYGGPTALYYACSGGQLRFVVNIQNVPKDDILSIYYSGYRATKANYKPIGTMQQALHTWLDERRFDLGRFRVVLSVPPSRYPGDIGVVSQTWWVPFTDEEKQSFAACFGR